MLQISPNVLVFMIDSFLEGAAPDLHSETGRLLIKNLNSQIVTHLSVLRDVFALK